MKKVKSLKEVEAAVKRARRAGQRIVATNGCFDILHVGHVRNLSAAKALGDILIVGVNSDASVRENKGPSRPIVPERERAEILAELVSVDYVFIFSGKTPLAWIKRLRPDIHVRGGGEDVRNHPDFPAHLAVVKSYGGTFVLVPHVKDRSTTRLIHKIRHLA